MRKTSETPEFPHRSRRLCYFWIIDGEPAQISHHKADLVDAYTAAANGWTLYAAWPGQYRTDLFIVDNPEQSIG